MIYISFALFKEAEPYINQYKLKKNMNIHPFPVYYNSFMTIVITGIGVINGSIGTTYMLSTFKINEKDIFVNIGIAGSNSKYQVGDIILCNKIIQNWDKKCLYPDMLYQHGFIEDSVETVMMVVDKPNETLNGNVIEMEAAGIYKAASIYFPLHHIFFIKIISDKLDDAYKVSKEQVFDLLNTTRKPIVNWLISIHDTIKGRCKGLSDIDVKLMSQVKNTMNLTENMYNQLIKMVVYYKSRQGNIQEILKPYISVEINSKNERKKYFEELRTKLMDA